jgi:hypothetical protein
MTQPQIHCMADSQCPRHHRGFRITSKERCTGCPDAMVKKWDWSEGRTLLAAYEGEVPAEW